ncbi:MAG: TolA-binding protein [Candidatus Omnitrophota bacterium]|jgi:TolA-binding protein
MNENKNKFLLKNITLVLTALSLSLGLCVLPALAVDDSFKEKKAKKGYIVDLQRLIKKSKSKIEQVDGKIQEQTIRRRNQQREEKARAYYEDAMRYFEEERYDKAQELWEKAIRITEHPEMKDYFSTSLKKTKSQNKRFKEQKKQYLKRLEAERGYSANEVDEVYEVAVDNYKENKWLEARNSFERVDGMFPNHKATRSYLMIIDQKIQKEQQEIIEKIVRKEGIAKKKEKLLWKKRLEDKERERSNALRNQADALYIEALSLYRVRHYTQAKAKFKEVERVFPDYKKTIKYLSRITADVEGRGGLAKEEEMLADVDRQIKLVQKERRTRQETELALKSVAEEDRIKRIKEEADFVYEAAVGLEKIHNYEEALIKFKEVRDILPNYKSTEKYIHTITKTLDKQFQLAEERRISEHVADVALERKNERIKVKSNDNLVKERIKEENRLRKQKASFAYRAAVAYYKNDLLEHAKERFHEVQEIYPGYKSTEKYLAKLDKNFDAKKFEYTEKVQLQNKERIEDLYKEAVKAYQVQKYTVALNQFKEIARIDNNYRSVQVYLSSIKQNLSSGTRLTDSFSEPSGSSPINMLFQAETQYDQKTFAVAADKYQHAVKLYQANNLTEAKNKFITVEATFPNFKETRQYLSNIDDSFNGGIRSSNVRTHQLENTREVINASDTNNVNEKLVSKRSWFGLKKSAKNSVETSKTSSYEVPYQTADSNTYEQENFSQDGIILNGDESTVQEQYKTGVALFKAKRYDMAQEVFENVRRLDADYRWTNWYMTRIGRNQKAVIRDYKGPKSTTKRTVTDQVQSTAADEAVLAKSERNIKKARKDAEKMTKNEKKRLKELEKQYKQGQRALARSKRDLENKEKEWATKFNTDKVSDKSENDFRSVEWKDAKNNRLNYNEQLLAEEKTITNNIAIVQGNVDQLREELREEILDELSIDAEVSYGDSEVRQVALLRNIENTIKKLKRQEEENRVRAEALTSQIEEYQQALKDQIFDKNKHEERVEAKDKEIDEALFTKSQLAEDEIKHREMRDTSRTAIENYEYEELKLKNERKEAKEMLSKIRDNQKELTKKEKDEWWRRQEEIKDELKRKHELELIRQVDPIYKDAKKLFNHSDYSEARTKFALVEELHPGYKDAAIYAKKSKYKLSSSKQEINEMIRSNETGLTPSKKELSNTKRNEYLRITKRDVEKTYNEAFDLYKADETDEADSKFEEMDDILMNGNFSESYLDGIYSRKMRKMRSIDLKVKNAKERTVAKERRREAKRQRDLARLENKVKREERKIERDRGQAEKLAHKEEMRQLEEQRTTMKRQQKEEARQREDDARIQKFEERRQAKKSNKSETVDKMPVKKSENKRQEIDGLFKGRKAELREERLRVSAGFSKHLDALYDRGEVMHRSKDYTGALHIFSEVDAMKANYKNTSKYIRDIEGRTGVTYKRNDPYSHTQSSRSNESHPRTSAISDALDNIEHKY